MRELRRSGRSVAVMLGAAAAVASCAPQSRDAVAFSPIGNGGERVRVLALYPGVTATIVRPAHIDWRERVDLILYALPNGNTTAETMGRVMGPDVGWRHDIQHIGAQTRALRTLGVRQAIVVYLEADTRSWPEWRRVRGYERANARIVELVDQVRAEAGRGADVAVTLTGHSGGGSFTWGFIDGQDALPAWLDRIAFLDSNYSFEPRHGTKIAEWLRTDPARTLVVIAYDDREIVLNGRKVVSDSGGTWRASERMIANLGATMPLVADTLGEFRRWRGMQVEILMHPNHANRILHTELVGEMNGYMHAMLARRREYTASLLRPERAYARWIQGGVELPAASPPGIPARAATARGGRAFIAAVESLPREERERAIRAELLAGNIPSFLRRFAEVGVTDTLADGKLHTIRFEVMPDYLAIGSDADFVRMPMTPYTAQAFCDAYGFALPTARMVDAIWRAAMVKVDPLPLTEAREAPATFLQHDRMIAAQLAGVRRGMLVAGTKKDVVVTPRLRDRASRVAIFGWHHRDGTPIQPLYTGHVDWYVDYSHGVRPVRRIMHVDGRPMAYEQVLADTLLAPLLSDEGVIVAARYER